MCVDDQASSRPQSNSPREPASVHRRTTHIEICGLGTSEAGEHFVKLRICAQGRHCYVLLPTDDLGSSNSAFFRVLNREGGRLLTPASQRELVQRLEEDISPSTFAVATKPGWCGPAFVLPDVVVARGEGGVENALGCGDPALASKFKESGSLTGWNEIPQLALGNSRLMLALALGFVGPVGNILGVEAPAIQLVGRAQSGKTGVGIAAGSIWGCSADPNAASAHGFGSTWNQTVNKIEDVAVAHNHTLLILDETRVNTRPEEVLQAAFRLDSGLEKGRQNADRPPRSWWVPVLSTSNLTVDQLAAAAKITADDAYRSRLIDVPLPADGSGIYEELHEHADPAALTAHLLRIAREHHGHAACKYLRRVVRWRARDERGLRGWLEKRRAGYLRRAQRLEGHGRDLSRFHGRFATIYAACRLAIKLGVLSWPWRDLRTAVLSCERSHIDLIAGNAAPTVEAESGKALIAKLTAERSRFVDTRVVADSKSDRSRAFGFIIEKDGRVEFLIPSQTFERLAGGKKNAGAAKTSLYAAGLIASNRVNGERKFVVKRTVPGVPDRSYYVVVLEAAFAACSKQ